MEMLPKASSRKLSPSLCPHAGRFHVLRNRKRTARGGTGKFPESVGYPGILFTVEALKLKQRFLPGLDWYCCIRGCTGYYILE